MPKPKSLIIDALNGVSGSVAASQSAAGAGELLINGSQAANNEWVADYPRQVDIESALDETGVTFTIYGSTRAETYAIESIAGANAGTVTTKKQWTKIEKIEVDGATTGAITISTNNTLYSPFVIINRYSDFDVGVAVILSSGASITYTVEHTLKRVNYDTTEDQLADYVLNHETLVNQTASEDGNYAFGLTATRCKITLTSGTAEFQVVQSDS